MNHKKIILIADDNQDDLQFINKAYEAAHYDGGIVNFNCGNDLVKFVEEILLSNKKLEPKEQVIFYCIVDLNMPNGSGFDVLRKIKGNENLSWIPVIVMSGSSAPNDVLECHKLGCNIYFEKPESYIKLKECIQSLVTLEHSLKLPHKKI
jgi:CheY-like chemotaxis protein